MGVGSAKKGINPSYLESVRALRKGFGVRLSRRLATRLTFGVAFQVL